MFKADFLKNTTAIGITESSLILMHKAGKFEIETPVHLCNILFHRDDSNSMELQNLETPGLATHFKWEEQKEVLLNQGKDINNIKTPTDFINYMNKTLYLSIASWIDDCIENHNSNMKNDQTFEIFNYPYPECWPEYLKIKKTHDNYFFLKSINHPLLFEKDFIELTLKDCEIFKLKSGDEMIFKTNYIFIDAGKIMRFIREKNI